MKFLQVKSGIVCDRGLIDGNEVIVVYALRSGNNNKTVQHKILNEQKPCLKYLLRT